MPQTNPNPDRASRSAAAPAATAPAAAIVTFVSAAAPAAIIAAAPAAAPATIALAPAPAAALARAPAPAAVFGIMPVRATGLQQPQNERKRTASVVRDDPAWKCVEITDETDAHQLRWRCLGCGKFLSGGATRVADHVLGRDPDNKGFWAPDALEMISHLEFSTRSQGYQHADDLLDRFGSRRFDSHGAQRLAAASIASYSCRDGLSSLAGL